MILLLIIIAFVCLFVFPLWMVAHFFRRRRINKAAKFQAKLNAAQLEYYRRQMPDLAAELAPAPSRINWILAAIVIIGIVIFEVSRAGLH